MFFGSTWSFNSEGQSRRAPKSLWQRSASSDTTALADERKPRNDDGNVNERNDLQQEKATLSAATTGRPSSSSGITASETLSSLNQ